MISTNYQLQYVKILKKIQGVFQLFSKDNNQHLYIAQFTFHGQQNYF
jgi:hypothetical protein